MFARQPERVAQPLRFVLDGRDVEGVEGDTVASALLALGVRAFRRNPATGEARGPFCLIGACFECLVEIDGLPGRRACLTTLRAGMRVNRAAMEPGAAISGP